MFNDKKVDSKNNKFLKLNHEKEEFNQYWFSESTIEFIVNQVEKIKADKIAFVSTPSIFFSCSPETQDKSVLFEYDDKILKKHKNTVFFDFNDYSNIKDYNDYFDLIIVDPPFINQAAWTKYSNFIKMISIKKDDKIAAKIITCSIEENKTMLK